MKKIMGMGSEYKPRYSGPSRSGICKCGHKWDEHHLGVVLNADYAADTHEYYIPQECEHYGWDEAGGLDENGKPHCDYYVDSMDEGQI
jgi:hypothetical protein